MPSADREWSTLMNPTRRAALPVVVLLVLSLVLTACMGDTDDDSDARESTATIAGSPTSTIESTVTAPTEEPTATATATALAPTATIAVEPSPTDDTAAASPTADDAVGSPAVQSEDAVVAEIEQVEEDMAELRGLEPTGDVEEAIIPRDQLADNLVESLEDDYSQDEADEDTRILWLLRLIDDPDLDLYQLYLDLYSESILGYYDPETDELYLVSDSGFTPLVEMTMAHEFVHALQDQYYDLEVLRPLDMEADQAAAITALIEGDAELGSTLYALQVMDPADLQALIAESEKFSTDLIESVPAYIRESLYFPYVEGSEFVGRLYQSGGYESVDEAYAEPPTSTEQILHPEKYLADERDEPQWPEERDIVSSLGDGWEQARSDTLGEFDLRIMLRENGATEPEDGAEGWDGGRYAYYSDASGDTDLITVDTIWDTEADAEEFVAAFAETYGVATPAALNTVLEDGQGRYTMILRDGVNVSFVSSSDRALVEEAMGAIGGE